jgi:Pyruvate/2-oxoacid:ferredoxin oxidoreductase delta subunit
MPPVIDSVARPGEAAEDRVEVVIDSERCNGCGLCVAFLSGVGAGDGGCGRGNEGRVAAGDKCCACYTCVGQCPRQAIQLRPAGGGA